MLNAAWLQKPVWWMGLAALPAISGSVLLMQLAGAPKALWVQQAVVALVCMGAALAWARASKQRMAVAPPLWLLLALAGTLWLPVLAGVAGASPQRWLGLLGFRLYIAPVVLPLFLLFWHRALTNATVPLAGWAWAGALAAMALLMQPS